MRVRRLIDNKAIDVYPASKDGVVVFLDQDGGSYKWDEIQPISSDISQTSMQMVPMSIDIGTSMSVTTIKK